MLLRYPSHGKRRRLRFRKLLPLALTFIASALCLSSYLYFASSRLLQEQHKQLLLSARRRTVSQQEPPNSSLEEGDLLLPFDVTLVTQTSRDRSWLLHYFCRRWTGPMSVAVLTDSILDAGARAAEIASTASCSSRLRNEPVHLEETLARRDRGAVAEIATFRQGRLRLGLFVAGNSSSSGSEKAISAAYPINALRNAALVAVSTSHLLTLDVDFLPSTELYDAILSQAASLSSRRLLAVVVPAFQRKGDKKYKDVSLARWRELSTREREPTPSTLAELSTCVATGGCVVFDSTWNPDAHSTTNSAAWLELSSAFARRASSAAVSTLSHRPVVVGRDNPASATKAELVPPLRFLDCFESNRFEPYVVLSKREAPVFNENFAGYGKNKIEYVARLRYSGFSFAVLPIGFVCHAPHPISRDKRKWLKQSRGAHDTDRLYKTSVDEMVRLLRPDGRNRTWLCDSKAPSQKAADPRRKKKKKKSKHKAKAAPENPSSSSNSSTSTSSISTPST